MHLLQKFCGAAIDASDASGESVAGLDVRSYRAHTYGHPDGIAAARASAQLLLSNPVHAETVDLDEEQLDFGKFWSAPRFVALESINPAVRAHMEGLDDVSHL